VLNKSPITVIKGKTLESSQLWITFGFRDALVMFMYQILRDQSWKIRVTNVCFSGTVTSLKLIGCLIPLLRRL
jgi:hypothetical protein